MHFPTRELASTGSLVRKMLGVDEGQYGLVLRVKHKGKKKALPYYVVMTDERQITEWMTCFVDVLSEVD